MTARRAFAKIWWPVIAVGVVCLAMLYSSWRLLLSITNDTVSGERLMIGVLIASSVALTGLYLFWVLLRDVGTVFTVDGLIRPTLRGRRVFLWSDLIGISSRGNYGVLVFSDVNVGINLLLFRDPQQVVAFVRSHLPPDARIEHRGLRDGTV
jgi:hypothetical protein